MTAARAAPEPPASAFARPAPILRAADAMHAGVVTCPPQASLAVAARIMAAHRIHAVVVPAPGPEGDAPAGQAVAGVVTDLDVLAALADGALHERTAAEAAADTGTVPLTVRADDELAHAVALMREHSATHVVVVHARTAAPIGVLSTLDVAEVIARDA
jgi:CBS domain-containing protein